MNFNYPAGYGPDTDVEELNLKNILIIDVFPGHQISISPRFKSSESNPNVWEAAICIYSMFSGSKVMQFGNHARQSTGSWHFNNISSNTLSFLIAAFHKKGPPNDTEPWHQTGDFHTAFGLSSRADGQTTTHVVRCVAYGELAKLDDLIATNFSVDVWPNSIAHNT
ncbi:hypothetical protein CKQ70_11125 [Bacillus toyonensis]|nr:hypothetical protein CKQ70_11125 [Bacillus toyonensis]PAW47081.1 hypothetical protein CKQ69_09170 [Bacillus toyonensis]